MLAIPENQGFGQRHRCQRRQRDDLARVRKIEQPVVSAGLDTEQGEAGLPCAALVRRAARCSWNSLRLIFFAMLGPGSECRDLGQQFFRIDRFHQIVLRTLAQAPDLVGFLTFRGASGPECSWCLRPVSVCASPDSH